MNSNDDESDLDRRRFLGGLAGTAALSALAGCSTDNQYDFVAKRAYLPADAAAEYGFVEHVEDALVTEQTRSVADVDVSARIESQYAVYDESSGGMGASALEQGAGASVEGPAAIAMLTGADASMKSGFLPILGGEAAVDPAGIVLFVPTPERETDQVGVMPGDNVTVVAHRSAVRGAKFVAEQDGVVVPNEEFWPAKWYDARDRYERIESEVLEDAGISEGIVPGGGVAYFPGADWAPAADVAERYADEGEAFRAGSSIDSEFVAAPASVFFGNDVAVTDPDNMAPGFGSFDRDGFESAEAAIVVFTDDDGREVSYAAYRQGDLVDASGFVAEFLSTTAKQIVFVTKMGRLFGEAFLDRIEGKGLVREDTGSLDPETTAVFPVPEEFDGVAPEGFEIADPVEGFGDDAVWFARTELAAPGGDAGGGVLPDGLSPYFDGKGNDAMARYARIESALRTRPGADVPARGGDGETFATRVRKAFFEGSGFEPTGATFLKAKKAFGVAETVSVAEVYTGPSGTGKTMDDEPETTLGVLSTPRASVQGQSLNPLAHMSKRDLLTSAQTASYLKQAGLGGGEWLSGPEKIASTSVAVVDKDTTMDTFAGVTGTADEPTQTLAHVVRVEDGDDVVVATGVTARTVTDSENMVTDPDNMVGDDGMMTKAEFEADRDRAGGAAGALEHD